MDTSDITWKISPDGKTAYAKLANGKGEVKLTRFGGSDPDKPAQISNVRYFAATWNSPFALYHSDHYFKGFGKSYELHHANGFTITVEASSDGKRVTTKKHSAAFAISEPASGNGASFMEAWKADSKQTTDATFC